MHQSTTQRVTNPPTADDPRPKRRTRAWVRIVIGITTLLLVAGGTNTALAIRDERRFPPPGQLVELSDGRQLHLHISGVGNSGPTVILEGGHGAFSPVFGHIQQAMSDSVQVVSYDRPGYGWSDPTDGDPLGVAGDLREALTLASVDGPFIVVGHSLGGLYARAFVSNYPEEVTGLVLIDPAHEHQLDRLPDEIVARMGPPTWLGGPMTAVAHLGVLRLLDPGAGTTVGLPSRSVAELGAFSVTPRYLRTYLAEARGFDRLAASTRPLAPHHPTIVLNAPLAQPGLELARPVMDEMNQELADDAPNASLIELPGADHTTIVTDRRHAEQVAVAVLELHRSAPSPR